MNASRIDIAEAVHGQCGRVADHREPTAPQRPADEMIILIDRPLGDSEDTPINPCPVAVVDMMFLGLVGVADLEGLGCREVAVLLRRETMELPSQRLPLRDHA